MPLVLATLAALISAHVIKSISGNNIIAGIAATWMDNLAFYGYIIFRDLKTRRFGIANLFKQARNMIIEFGPAEYFDSFLLRPFYLSAFPYFISNYSLAILLGSLTAEITYFIPTIFSYEVRKKIFKD
ncbi:MAG: hypothetical protein HY617_02055 [Candidatus Sungbacteria bacterium]|nr:hypothetical protein [Candidatus Sungbacteria bacterium]